MKYVLIVGDGMADMAQEALGGLTPLAYAAPAGMRRIAGGELGRVRTCPPSLPPGSDVAFLTLMGYEAERVYAGRSPLEAAGEGIALAAGEVSLRMNLVTLALPADGRYEDGVMDSYNGGDIAGQEAFTLVTDLLALPAFRALCEGAALRVTPTPTFRHIAVLPAAQAPFDLTPPHDIAGQSIAGHLPRGQRAELLLALQRTASAFLSAHAINRRRAAAGKLPANGIWFWGPGRQTTLESFAQKYGLRGTVVSAVPLVRGIAFLGGLRAPRVPGATGALETNHQGKVEHALAALADGDDFVLVHLEAPDDLSHQGDLAGKLEAIRRLDARIIQPLMAALDARGEPYRLLLMPDHYTLLSTRTHDGTPVPYAIHDSRRPAGPARIFCEQAAAALPLLPSGDALMRRLFAPGPAGHGR